MSEEEMIERIYALLRENFFLLKKVAWTSKKCRWPGCRISKVLCQAVDNRKNNKLFEIDKRFMKLMKPKILYGSVFHRTLNYMSFIQSGDHKQRRLLNILWSSVIFTENE